MQTSDYLDCSFQGLFGDDSNLFAHGKGRMVIQGHRGGFQPGNSLANFMKAIEHGVPMAELDVSIEYKSK